MRAMLSCRMLFLVTFAAVLWGGCSKYDVRDEQQFHRVPRGQVPLLLLQDPRLLLEHEPVEAYVRAQRLLDRLVQEGQLPVVAPWEVDLAPGESWPTGTRALARLLADNSVDPSRSLLVSLTVERVGGSRRVLSGEATMSQSERTSFVVRLQVETFVERDIVYRVETSFEGRAEEGRLQGETRTRLDEAVDEVARELVRVFRVQFRNQAPGVMPGIQGIDHPRQMLHYAGVPGEALGARVEPWQERDARAEVSRWFRLVEPQLTDDMVVRMAGLPAGLWVTDPGTVASRYGLQAGDFIVRANRQSVFGRTSLQRVYLATPREQPVQLVVLRSGEEHRLSVPRL